MKLTKKLFAVALAGVMGLSMFATPVFADPDPERTVNDDSDGGTITTTYNRVSQNALSTNVDYSWDDLTWTYCVGQGQGNTGWIKGNAGGNTGAMSHSAYANLITIPAQNATNLAQDITVKNDSPDPMTLTIALGTQDGEENAHLVIYEKTNDEYAQEATESISNVALGAQETKIYGVYPTGTVASSTTGLLTLTFGH